MMLEGIHGFLRLLGFLVPTAAVSSAAAYALFQFLGKQWLSHYLAKEIERFKHEQQKEIEQLRHRINSEFSRISKIHEKEFEVLPASWNLLHLAYGWVSQINSPLISGPSFHNISEEEFELIVENSELLQPEKNRLLRIQSTDERRRFYWDATRRISISKARDAQINLNNYLIINSIFMTTDLRDSFKEVNRSLESVVSYHERLVVPGNEDRYNAKEKTVDGLPILIDKIELAVQNRLHYDEA